LEDKQEEVVSFAQG